MTKRYYSYCVIFLQPPHIGVMDQEEARQLLTGEARLVAYLDAIAGVLGHARRAAAAQAYCTGLLLPGERKSIEPMAAWLDPTHVQAKHQALHHVVAQA